MNQDAIARALFDLAVRRVDDWRRPHLGASLIGSSCNRFLWMVFRWASKPELARDGLDHDGRMLRLFGRGHREEDLIIRDLQEIPGLQVISRSEDGQQIRVAWHGGHFSGSSDGRVLGVPAAPKTWHLLEIKTANRKLFDEVVRLGVEKAQPEHYAQMQVYMLGQKLERALYIVVCKDDDRIHTERVRVDRRFGQSMVDRAQLVVESPEPLSRVKDDPAYFECKLCHQYAACQLGQVERLERNCRTCASSTPKPDGTWWCEHKQSILDVDAQRAGCESHLFIPKLLPWPAVDADEAARRVVYKRGDGLHVIDHHRALSVGAP